MRERYTHRQKEITDENHNHHNERMLFHGKRSDASLLNIFFFVLKECIKSSKVAVKTFSFQLNAVPLKFIFIKEF